MPADACFYPLDFLRLQRYCIDDGPAKKSFLRAGVQPPMTMEEHVERLEELYSKVAYSKPNR